MHSQPGCSAVASNAKSNCTDKAALTHSKILFIVQVHQTDRAGTGKCYAFSTTECDNPNVQKAYFRIYQINEVCISYAQCQEQWIM